MRYILNLAVERKQKRLIFLAINIQSILSSLVAQRKYVNVKEVRENLCSGAQLAHSAAWIISICISILVISFGAVRWPSRGITAGPRALIVFYVPRAPPAPREREREREESGPSRGLGGWEAGRGASEIDNAIREKRPI